MSQKIDLTKLEPEQILEFKRQLNGELEHLETSYQALKTAQAKYQDCGDNVQRINANDKKALLVPLTSSLYVPGKVKDSDKFLIDVGTGYYIEKTTEQALEFFQNRLTKLTEDSKKLSQLINEKLQALERVDSILRTKIMEREKKQ
ncbi:hypothetical protein HPODL_00168 [Ogataea parapolymorpha DL-1]|uniref:Prefoldin subunit 5 n=1 Tax=Ogataea parapolymorpha (strain ATCC 26012 / BCRC 20466 / JCM 22074 / NRRL Y-7560 / DL-1) TaxID=871575 RepID=W1QF98_OGAPD|nr:hypothetical protein HPODL_00168 [Ogataea parapolymorpha DL-1]ESX00752.1 hypothetical protein HPODL_00168 [Ogataea parapolymorpha DL-1]